MKHYHTLVYQNMAGHTKLITVQADTVELKINKASMRLEASNSIYTLTNHYYNGYMTEKEFRS